MKKKKKKDKRTQLKRELDKMVQEKTKKYNVEYRKTHSEELKRYDSMRYRENKEKHSLRARKYYLLHRDKILQKSKLYYIHHRKEKSDYDRLYAESHKEQIRKRRKKYWNKRRKIEPKLKLNMNISLAIWHSLKGNKDGRHWETFVDFTREDLMKHLEKTLPKGMTWQDYLDGKLHIDHIIPISAFNFDSYTDIDFKRCWALSNLQLLEKTGNLKKGNSINKPFQPSLKI